MDDLNIPVEQAPAVVPPTRTDDQILPLSKWVPIGKSNIVLDVHKPQRNPIFPIDVALLKNPNFFRAFTTSSTIPAIYIQQFWGTMCFNSSTGFYSCQLDEQWFNLYKDILRDALNITPANDNNPFVAPPSSDTVIEYVNTLGYPNTLKNVLAMSVNALYQPWRAILSMINMCLTGKTVGFDRPRYPTFLTNKKNLATAARGKKKTTHMLIPSVRFTKLIIHHLRTKHNIHPRTGSPLHYLHKESILNTLRFIGKDGREIFGMPIPNALLTDEIKGAPYYGDYQEHVAKYQQFLDEEPKATIPVGDKAPKPTATQPPKPKPAPTQPSKAVSEKKRKLVKETPDEPLPAKRSKGVPVEEPTYNEEDANLQRALELSLIEQGAQIQGPARPMVIRELESGRIQPLPERCPLMPTNSSAHAELPSMDAELNLTDSETESDEEARKSEKVIKEDVTFYGTPLGLPSTFNHRHHDPPPPPAGASGAPGTSGASGSSQLPPPPPPPSTGTSGAAQQQGSKAPSSSKTTASASQSMAWTTFDTRFESTAFTDAQELSPTNSLMQDDSILDEQVHLSDDEDSGNNHLPKADSRQDWWKPLPKEERPATSKPA
ncbi:retrovirus-related pol polyprotein from transposon TNT 1-94 [Tanacetum coccineum]